MREFHVLDWYHVTGRGDVAYVLNDEEYENGRGHMIGETVLLDGKEYVVKGIEYHCVLTVPKGVNIGLHVMPKGEGVC